MPELTVKERLQPSLLDRLTNDAPDRQREVRDQWVINEERLRELVLRDISWLLNCENQEGSIDFEPFPEVRRSVLNYGVPTLSGKGLSGIRLRDLEQQVRDILELFEPRLLSGSLRISGQITDSYMSNRSLVLEIEGDLWAQPVPQRLLLRTEFDLDTASVTLTENRG